ncbi:MAG: efflux RND transporter periplasmic adaptor subunit [bacterium]|nr:efflux RND transporter periplasmic adaptor subunit [bacterium]
MNKTTLLTILVALVAIAAGWWGRGLMSTEHDMSSPSATASADGPCPGGAEPLYWKAPMDPSYVRESPGKSPMGMDLVPECPGVANAAPEGAVIIDSATMQNIGVRTAPVERRDLAREVRAVGRVAYDERRVAHVHTKVQGWIENLFVDFVGQEVKRGQPLLEIYSPELVATQEELLLAARYRESTEDSPFEDVRGGGASLFEATKRRLALWDIADRDVKRLLETGEVKRTLTLYAPASGYITRLGVRSGMEVQPNSNLYTIADLSRVWVLADVYEFELPWLELGQMAHVELSYLPGVPMQGELTYIAPFLDPKTRTAEVRLELDNADGKLKPEMFGNAVIAGAPRPGALAIPTDAVIRSGTRTVAIVALGDGQFAPRDIQLGLDSGDGWLEVLSGLDEGEDVVVSSQFLIDSESNLQEAVQKLLAARAGDAAEVSEDHSGHEMPGDETMDHSGHDMPSNRVPPNEAPMNHEGHSMPMEHSMPDDHSMHSGHQAPATEHDRSKMAEE